MPSIAQNTFSETTYETASLLYSADMTEDVEKSAWKLFANYSTYDFNHTQIDDLFYKLDSKEKLALVTYDVAGEDNYAGLSRIVIPSEVEYEGVTYKTNGIAASAFENCKDLEYVQLRCDKSQVTIEDRAFANCVKLTEFNDNGNRVGFFGKSVFENCPALTTFTMPEYLKEIGDSCFMNDMNLKTLVFNSGINKIGVSAFENCSALDIIVIPENVTSVPAYAFKGCADLEIVNIPKSVAEIGDGAFAGCDKITSIYLHTSEPANIDGQAFSDAACTGANVYVPEGSVAVYRASGWNVFANIKEGDTDRIKIGHYYYVLNNADNTAALTYSDRGEDNYKGMTEISIPVAVSFDGREFTVCAVNGGSLSMCANLQTLTLPSTLKTIKDSSITQNPELETINLCEGLEVIEGFSIRKNPKLINITLPNSLISLGNYAFDHNTSLREIVIPDLVPSIGEEVFYDCPSLEKVTIGKSVTYLNYMSFRSCGSLKEIRVLAQMPPRWGASVFDNSAYETVTVIVPEESLQQYMEDSNWSKFLHIEAERSSGVAEIESQDISVNVNGGVIEVSGLSENEYMEIYDIAGQRIYSGNPMGVSVTPGVYIVKAGVITRKIIVKS